MQRLKYHHVIWAAKTTTTTATTKAKKQIKNQKNKTNQKQANKKTITLKLKNI